MLQIEPLLLLSINLKCCKYKTPPWRDHMVIPYTGPPSCPTPGLLTIHLNCLETGFNQSCFIFRYTGAVCHTSLNFMSCVQYHNAHPDSQYAETTIDIDGSGPLAPFQVRSRNSFTKTRNASHCHKSGIFCS